MNPRALQIVSSLIRLNLLNGDDRVLFFGDNSIEYFVSMMAMYYLNLTSSPCKPANGPFEVINQLDDFGATLMVVTANKLSVVEQVLQSVGPSSVQRNKLLLVLPSVKNGDQIENGHEQVDRLKANPKLKSTLIVTYEDLISGANSDEVYKIKIPYFPMKSMQDICLIVYTSGTTGLPKGAMHSHSSFLNSLANMSKVAAFSLYSPRPQAVAWSYPFGHVSGCMIVPTSLLVGQTVVMLINIANMDQVFDALHKYQVELTNLDHSLLVELMDRQDLQERLTTLKSVLFAGSKLCYSTLQALQQKYTLNNLFELYGATESMGSVGSIERATVDNDPSIKLVEPDGFAYDELALGHVGSPMPGMEMKIIDIDSGHSLPANQAGEICFRGACRFVGYLNNRSATESTIDVDGWYHSGDVGHYDDRARLYITDRIKELIKYKSWSIAPAEIEHFIESHPAVRACCVVGVPHATESAHLRAYVQLKPNTLVHGDEIVGFVESRFCFYPKSNLNDFNYFPTENMGYHKRLNGGVVFVDHVPRTILGKVYRKHFKNITQNELITEHAKL